MTLSVAIAGSRKMGLLALVAAGATMLAGCAVGTTGFPDAVSVDGARLNGKIASTTGGSTSYWAQYGKTTAYGSESPHQSETVTEGTSNPVTIVISGLQRNSVYHYRVCARDSQAGTCGQDRTLTTQNVICGQTVTTDVRLTGDLDCDFDPLGPVAGPNGLVVGADGIDINLAGHGIGGGGVGIDNQGGFDDVTVRNGDLGGSSTGIAIAGGLRNVVRSLNLQASSNAMTITGGGDNTVHAVSMLGRLVGLTVDSSPGTVVSSSTIFGVFGAPVDLAGDRATVSDSTLTSTLAAVRIAGSGNRLLRNHVGPQPGFSGPFGGILVVSGAGNRLVGNEVRHILAVNPSEEGDGIHVNSAATATLLRSNVTSENQGDGIDGRDTTARLEGNTANSNSDLGIEAVAGVTDLGGNIASGNGNPLQCLNVFCQ